MNALSVSRRGRSPRVVTLLLACHVPFGVAGRAAAPEPEVSAADRDFFESRIRPILVEHCYKCHNSSTRSEGGLAVDSRDRLRNGGDSGPALTPGDPEASLLLSLIRHEDDARRMPADSAKLSAEVLSDFATWIERGATDPRDAPPTGDELAAATSWETVRKRRENWWSLQPVALPAIPAAGTSDHPVDRFIAARLEAEQLQPAKPADPRTLIRRVTFALTGLPPTPREVRAFVAASRHDRERAYEAVVDRLLASPRFGERWARHWMDWFRYADSHGSEADATIPYAWRYRDYLIRALNRDVSYLQLVREHIAGDLLEPPRIDHEAGINESVLGVAHYRFVQHGYAPTDPLEEQVRFTDNQIDVISKAILGLTVSCARCHDHKFDAVGQSDFYALYGILVSSRPGIVTVDLPDRLHHNKRELRALKRQIRAALGRAWLSRVAAWKSSLAAAPLPPPRDKQQSNKQQTNKPEPAGEANAWQQALEEAERNAASPLRAWIELSRAASSDWQAIWQQLAAEVQAGRSPDRAGDRRPAWDLATSEDYASWYKTGNGLPAAPSRAGDFAVLSGGDNVIANIYPAGVYSHLISSKHNAVLHSPRVPVDFDAIWVRALGGQNARLRFAMQSFPRVEGGIYRTQRLNGDRFRWYRLPTAYWRGDDLYLEIATAGDLPVGAEPKERSFFGVSDIVVRNDGEPEPRDELGEYAAPLFGDVATRPRDRGELVERYAIAMSNCLEAFRSDSMTDGQARFLGYFVARGLIPNRLEDLPEVAPLVARYRSLEAEVVVPTRAPGVWEGDVRDSRLFVRGNHKQPGDPVPRRFLEALGDGRAYDTSQSGRLELAADLVADHNPLTARVAVNRLWHHTFGRGIVATPDNLGRLGQLPSHPKLLDYLAHRFLQQSGSIKRMLRFLVMSRTFRQDSRGSSRSREIDPDNILLASMNARRLEAEAIRDSLLAVSGSLDEQLYGPPVDGNKPRRSVYVRVRRNRLDPFLRIFDAPPPTSTKGNRDTTNVPAQSLALMNDPRITELASEWVSRLAGDTSGDIDPAAHIAPMFERAIGREPTATERDAAAAWLSAEAARRESARRELATLASRARRVESRRTELEREYRSRLLERTIEPAPVEPAPRPIASWEFDEDLRDAIGKLHGTPHGKAALVDGGLVLDGQTAYVSTAPLTTPLTEKTLEAWVLLDNLEQRGGGLMSIQTLDGGTFDAIVFGEQAARQWIAGSNFFARTQPVGGSDEVADETTPVHVAVAYDRDGTVTLYRDGEPYGRPYLSSGPLVFDSGAAEVLFGLRHGAANPSRLLTGTILRARLYDRALNATEVQHSYQTAAEGISAADLVAAMTPADREQYATIKNRLAMLEARRAELTQVARPGVSRTAELTDLARAIFSLKEFIYIR